MIRLCIFLAIIVIPGAAVYLALTHPEIHYRWLFVSAISGHIIFRTWETYFTSKEKKVRRTAGDWTIPLTTFSYVVLCFVLTFEFFLFPRDRFVFITLIGIAIYVIGTRLRFWGEKTLGSQWAIHAVGEKGIKKVRLLTIGPYEFIRHPIYAGIMLDQLALPIIVNTPIAFLFVLVVNTPFMLIRLWCEEKSSFERFGRAYDKYKMTTGALFPVRDFSVFFRKLCSNR